MQGIAKFLMEKLVAKKRSGDLTEQQSGKDFVSDFMARYRKEYDFYEQACRMAAHLLDTNLQSAGVRAIVTSRAKNPTRLEVKIRQRASTKKYENVEQIYEDIADLAGIRVALYFPAEREEAGRIILSLFSMVETPKEFPDSAKPQPASYKKRFSGYWATHYRARIRDEKLNESQKRYLEAKFEIQVASVLMHAWSEVEHDLVYKPLQGELSPEEYSILDELNGLILAGEIALERLQHAGEARVSHNQFYTNHYDLATSLLELARKQSELPELHEALIGRVDLLFKLLNQLEQNTPEHLARYVKALHSDFERRSIAEQVIDRVLAEDPKRYAIFNEIRAQDGSTIRSEEHDQDAIDELSKFLTTYEEFEKNLGSSLQISKEDKKVDLIRRDGKVVKIPQEFIDRAIQVRQFRNKIVHGEEIPDLRTALQYQRDLESLIDQLWKLKG